MEHHADSTLGSMTDVEEGNSLSEMSFLREVWFSPVLELIRGCSKQGCLIDLTIIDYDLLRVSLLY